MSDWSPEPEERGQREPPRRYPPTAVGVATPPPPHRRPSRYREPLLRRIGKVLGASVVIGALGIAAGMTLATTTLIELGSALTVLDVVAHVVRRRARPKRADRSSSARAA